MFNNNVAMTYVFNTLFDKGYQLQKRKENSFFVILPSGSKYEIWDNGNDCICVGSWNESYDYQCCMDRMVDYVEKHVLTLK